MFLVQRKSLLTRSSYNTCARLDFIFQTLRNLDRRAYRTTFSVALQHYTDMLSHEHEEQPDSAAISARYALFNTIPSNGQNERISSSCLHISSLLHTLRRR
ncbi:hypothetical protein MRB53_038548 [Persea americana]|nr:hypothetical protein MRB53_038548 [Persea americana]